ncbi:hypothetical protein LINPERPRIM_LOCUS678 [Linum perenne]
MVIDGGLEMAPTLTCGIHPGFDRTITSSLTRLRILTCSACVSVTCSFQD